MVTKVRIEKVQEVLHHLSKGAEHIQYLLNEEENADRVRELRMMLAQQRSLMTRLDRLYS